MSLRQLISGHRTSLGRQKRTAFRFVPAIQCLEDRKLLSNSPPTVNNGEITTLHDTPVSGTLSAYDPDGNTVTFSVVGQPSHGTVTVNDDGSFTYTPNPGYAGPDSFAFKGNDGTADSDNTGTETIDVTNQPPNADDGSVGTPYDETLSGTLSAYDPDGDTVTFSLVAQASHGTVTVNSNGSFTYVPSGNYAGTDSFTFKANDGIADGNTATVTVDVDDSFLLDGVELDDGDADSIEAEADAVDAEAISYTGWTAEDIAAAKLQVADLRLQITAQGQAFAEAAVMIGNLRDKAPPGVTRDTLNNMLQWFDLKNQGLLLKMDLLNALDTYLDNLTPTTGSPGPGWVQV